jgi:hypothetical protein
MVGRLRSGIMLTGTQGSSHCSNKVKFEVLFIRHTNKPTKNSHLVPSTDGLTDNLLWQIKSEDIRQLPYLARQQSGYLA